MEFRKMIIFLDLTEMDNLLIRYTSFLADLLKAEKTFFVHFLESSELPAEVSKLFPELDQPIDQVIEEELVDQVGQHFSCSTWFFFTFDAVGILGARLALFGYGFNVNTWVGR